MDDPKAVLAHFTSAVNRLFANEDFFSMDPGEPVLTAELTHLLHAEFPAWTVMNEYDRREMHQKRLAYRIDDKGTVKEAAIRPDIIVHRVGAKENLLVIEVKRHVNKQHKNDIWKLRGMTDQRGEYAYAVGIHMIINIAIRTVPRCDV